MTDCFGLFYISESKNFDGGFRTSIFGSQDLGFRTSIDRRTQGARQVFGRLFYFYKAIENRVENRDFV
jgi:hypothetical protein